MLPERLQIPQQVTCTAFLQIRVLQGDPVAVSYWLARNTPGDCRMRQALLQARTIPPPASPYRANAQCMPVLSSLRPPTHLGACKAAGS